MKRAALITAGVLYVAVAFLTFGYGVNRPCTYYFRAQAWEPGCEPADTFAGPLAMVWPIYWAARLSIEITRPEQAA